MESTTKARGTRPFPERGKRDTKHRSAFGALLLVAFGGLVSWRALPQGASQAVDEVRATLEKMVETRRILSQERRDWAIGREMLQDRIAVVEHESETLREKLANVQGNVADADKKRAELVAVKASYAADSRALLELAGSLEARTLGLLVRLPDPIRERVQPLSQRIPEDPAETKESLSNRFQNVVGILDQVDKFNREISVVSEVRTLAGGARAEVTAFYLGIGHGYYVTADGSAAGIGTGTPEGWQWSPSETQGPNVARAIAIWKNEKGADFVPLPIRIE